MEIKCVLRRSLYDSKQAGRSWYNKVCEVLKECGAVPTKADPCVFTIGKGSDATFIVFYVDDILIASRSKRAIATLKCKLSTRFELKYLGKVNRCLGIDFIRDRNQIRLNQKTFIYEILNKFGMSESNLVSTPMGPNTKLSKPTDKGTSEEEKLPYRELIGALTYLSLGTRPDISFAVSFLAQFNHCYRKVHWTAAKTVLRYLKGTIEYGITFKATAYSVQGFVDVDLGNCLDDGHSYTGFSFMLSGGPISWESKKQRTVALSTTEAEYMALTEAAKESIYLKKKLIKIFYANLGWKI